MNRPFFVEQFSGTSNLPLNFLFYALLGIGLIRLFKQKFLLGFIFTAISAAYIVMSFVTRSNFAHVPLVLSRYIIPAFPMSYLLVALGLEGLWNAASVLPVNQKIVNALCYTATGFFLAGLFWTGPLRQVYVAPNNFTGHSAFQESYAPIDWTSPRISDMIQRPYWVSKEHMSIFYRTLSERPDVHKIIEYPMLIGNHFNLFCYYQRFHGKKVTVGYTRSIKDSMDSITGGVLGDMIVDQVLSQIKDPVKLKFQNMVDLLDMAAIKKNGADLAVFHKNWEVELFGFQPGKEVREIPLVMALSGVYKKIYGKPVFEDRNLIVFDIRDPVSR